MKVLLSGASSFSGYWFAHTLASKGHEVTVTCTQAQRMRIKVCAARRIERLKDPAVSSGIPRLATIAYVDLIAADRFDVLCVHGAYVTITAATNFR
jgi:UDP-glucose 4-epimerase